MCLEEIGQIVKFVPRAGLVREVSVLLVEWERCLTIPTPWSHQFGTAWRGYGEPFYLLGQYAWNVQIICTAQQARSASGVVQVKL